MAGSLCSSARAVPPVTFTEVALRGQEAGWAPFPQDHSKHLLEKCPAFDLWLYSSLGCKATSWEFSKTNYSKNVSVERKIIIIIIIKTKHFNNSLHNLTQNIPPHPSWLPAGWEEETSSHWKWYHKSLSALGRMTQSREMSDVEASHLTLSNPSPVRTAKTWCHRAKPPWPLCPAPASPSWTEPKSSPCSSRVLPVLPGSPEEGDITHLSVAVPKVQQPELFPDCVSISGRSLRRVIHP